MFCLEFSKKKTCCFIEIKTFTAAGGQGMDSVEKSANYKQFFFSIFPSIWAYCFLKSDFFIYGIGNSLSL